MRKTAVERWWALVRGMIRLAQKNGAWPSSAELGRYVKLTRRETMRYLGKIREDGLAVLLEAGPESGWRPTAEGARWVELEIPELPVDVPRREIRSDPYRLRKHRQLERSRARMASLEVLDGAEVFES